MDGPRGCLSEAQSRWCAT